MLQVWYFHDLGKISYEKYHMNRGEDSFSGPLSKESTLEVKNSRIRLILIFSGGRGSYRFHIVTLISGGVVSKKES